MERFAHGGDTYEHPGVLDFSANLNPVGMPQAAREALAGCVDACASYPDPACRDLTRAIARYEGLDQRMVLACAGATDAFARLCLGLCPTCALVCAPCYSGYEQALRQVGAEVEYVALSPERGFAPGPEIIDALHGGIDLVFVANPNNPSGRCIEGSVLAGLLRRSAELGIRVVLDECFIDLTDHAQTSTALLPRHPNLVVVKALTKSFALAGLRVGYALSADEGLMGLMRDAGQPWAVSVPAQVAGVACLDGSGDYLERSRALIAHERERLGEALAAYGLRVVPSQANFLLWHAERDLRGRLLEEGVMVRSCANYVGLDERWHRSAVRTPAENDAFIGALGRVVA